MHRSRVATPTAERPAAHGARVAGSRVVCSSSFFRGVGVRNGRAKRLVRGLGSRVLHDGPYEGQCHTRVVQQRRAASATGLTLADPSNKPLQPAVAAPSWRGEDMKAVAGRVPRG